MSLQETFIENLKFYRKQAKFSQKDLSIMLNKGYNYVNSIEGGVSFPPPQVIDEIAGILHIEPEILFSKSGSPANINASFRKRYAATLKDTLISHISAEIEKICREMIEK
ncbi:helix-turn-helix domain-containing protein [Treponema brennaborense]|uniref:Helix-turn-helix domain protein n=1 Tax=Treponema brennaborense (strain DSM 12168 / CIP 105900 / DD5/3) TaxID=906968 RepID=F4LKP6_TREBD|nr:helix-turn-helix transcriptional regulator [Treponema brennaborense]AEE15507.1 helix-turn-helix domain protein [Treponema brennaborense DSM 12168]